MVQMPTGTGKTVVLAEVIKNEEVRIESSSVILVVAHRRELIEQIKEMIDSFGIDREKAQVRVESIQTLARKFGAGAPDAHRGSSCAPSVASGKAERLCNSLRCSQEGQSPCAPGLVIVDEAHHALAKSYRWMWEQWPEAKFLGLTATPCRLNGAGFTDLFDTLLQADSIRTFIEKGWLSDFEYVSASPESVVLQQVRSLKKRGADGDYQTKEMVAVMDVPESTEHLYRTYQKFAGGKKGIVYAIDRQHAQHIAACYRQHGVNCEVIDSKTPREEREKIVEAYRSTLTAHRGQSLCNSVADATCSQQGQSPCAVDVLVNVDIFGEGFDVPEVEFIQLARPTLSLSKYLQQVGRGMRISKGKEAVTIIDQVGLYQTFGLPTDERNWRQMFLGKASGKGDTGHHRLVLKDEDLDDKMLVNLQMARIRRRGEPHRRVEVFMENGMFGILKDGQVSCPPMFVHIKRMEAPYFAVATYPYEIYRSRRTVIDDDGRDCNLKLFGQVDQREEWLVYDDEKGRRMWGDGKGGRCYPQKPGFEQMGGIDVVNVDNRYMLRKEIPNLNLTFSKDEVLVGPVFCIFKDMLVFKDFKKVFRVIGYQNDCIIVHGGRHVWKEMKVRADGTIDDSDQTPYWANREKWPSTTSALGLRRLPH